MNDPLVPPKNPTVLVTGGAGYIGSHTAKALKEKGFSPVLLDDLSTGHPANTQGLPLEQGSITNPLFLKEVFAKHRPSAVLHFAAKLAVAESVEDPEIYYHTNVYGTICLLTAMRESGVDKLIFSSSAAVYGIPDSTQITENTPKNPINPYGRTKWMVEQMLTDYAQAYGLKSVSLRYFNAAGAAPDGTLGNRNPHPQNLIPIAVNVLAKEQDKLNIYGIDYPTPDGTCVRDYVHVTDLATAHVLALEYLLNNGKTTALNLGSNKGHSVKDVVQMLKNISNLPLPVTYSERRPGDPAALVANATEAQKRLGWQPHHSDLKTICETAWNWRKSLITEE